MHLQNLKIPQNPLSVGHLDKAPIFLPKTTKSVPKTQILVDFSVGRQHPQNPHARTLAGEKTHKPLIVKQKQPLLVCHKYELDFFKTIPKIFTEIENLIVVFHSPDFVDSVHESYTPLDAHVFLEWVKAFALIRCENREKVTDSIIKTADDDFLLALRFFKTTERKPYRRENKQLNRETALVVIEKHFKNESFTCLDIQKHCLVERYAINKQLQELREQNIILPVRKTNKLNRYKLILQ